MFVLRIFKLNSQGIECMKIFRYADKISIGDEVLAQENDDLTPAKVTDTPSFTLQGEHAWL